ncbi:hypothetical protein JYU20_04225, partial [Bacteroidales bacterium AH-315-I05]|nr:hypothetical protein [Bacteroidales bacterium AH-315-I05]
MRYKLLILKFALFIVGFALIHFALLKVFQFYAVDRSFVNKLYADFLAIEKPVKFLFIGDSHCGRDIDTDYIQDAYKFAVGGESNINTYYKLRQILQHSNAGDFEYLMLTANITAFTTFTRNLKKNTFHYRQFHGLNDLLKENDHSFKKYASYFKYKFIPYIEMKEFVPFFGKAHKKLPGNRIADINRFSDEENQKEADFFVRNLLLQENQKNVFDKEAVLFVQKTIELCKEHNIKVIYIKYPMSRFFVNATVSFVEDSVLSNSPVEQIIKKNSNAILLDYLKTY